MIVEDHGIAMATALADAAEARPNRGDGGWSKDRCTRCLIKDLIAFVHDLHVLSGPHGAVGIGRRATASDTWKWDTVKIKDRGRHGVRDQEPQQTMVNDRI